MDSSVRKSAPRSHGDPTFIVFYCRPTLVKSMWGSEHHGRNFGMVAYAPFFGTTLWTALFAYNVENHKMNPGTGTERCVGTKCWRATFQVCFAVLLVALISVSGLWRRWRATV